MKSPDKISRQHKVPKSFLLKKLKTRRHQDYHEVYFPRNIFGISEIFFGCRLHIQAISKTYELKVAPLCPAGLKTYVRMIFAHKYFFFARALFSLGRKPKHLGRRELQAGPAAAGRTHGTTGHIPTTHSTIGTSLSQTFTADHNRWLDPLTRAPLLASHFPLKNTLWMKQGTLYSL